MRLVMRLVALVGVLVVACSAGGAAPAPSLPPDTTVVAVAHNADEPEELTNGEPTGNGARGR